MRDSKHQPTKTKTESVPLFEQFFLSCKLAIVHFGEGEGGGGKSHDKKDGGAGRKFSKDPLRDTEIQFCGCGL